MCFAIIEITFRGEKGAPQTKRVESADQLQARIKECQALPEAMKVKVYLYQEHTSTERVEEWRSRALMQKVDEREQPNN